MEYRLRYRDIPWSVAIAVLPGKIIGRYLCDPAAYTVKNWKQVSISLLKGVGYTLLTTVMLILTALVFDFLIK